MQGTVGASQSQVGSQPVVVSTYEARDVIASAVPSGGHLSSSPYSLDDNRFDQSWPGWCEA